MEPDFRVEHERLPLNLPCVGTKSLIDTFPSERKSSAIGRAAPDATAGEGPVAMDAPGDGDPLATEAAYRGELACRVDYARGTSVIILSLTLGKRRLKHPA